MLYTSLGSTGLKVSQIGLGTWQFGTGLWGWGKDYGEQDAIESLRRGVELGVNFIDTAEIYGNGLSERIIGKAIKGMREQVVIATKVWSTHLTYNGVIKACERSLRRLDIKTIDLYQVHWPNPLIPISQTMKAMEKLVKEGKVNYIGVSNFSLKKLLKAQESLKRERIVSNQIKYNLIEREAEKELLPYAAKEKITVIAYSPLAQGLLTGKYSAQKIPRDTVRKINILFDKQNLIKLKPLLDTLRNIAARRNKTVTQVALNWLIKRPEVVAIPGVKNAQQAEENAGAADFTLDDQELEQIENTYSKISVDKLRSRIKLILRLFS